MVFLYVEAMILDRVINSPVSQSLSRNLSREEWRRFKIYTARVVTLGIPNLGNTYFWSLPQAWLSVETIQLIGMESQRGGFWPGLCSLRCNIGWEIVPLLSSFLNPTITHLSLILPLQGNRLLQPALSLLAHTCQQLQSLKVDADTSDPLSGSEMGLLISASRRTLRHLEIKPSTPPNIFPAIFDLPQLQDLTLQKPHLPSQIPPNVLPRFRAISFGGNHGPNLLHFLKEVPTLALTTVTISHGGLIQLSATLNSLRGASATMNTLYLAPVMALDHSSITLLCSFTNLKSLSIGCICEDLGLSESCSLQLTDENIRELGGALPHINLLSLAPCCRGPRHVTFASLICLSRMCGNLGSLSIRIDFTSVVDGSDQLDRGPGVNNARPQRATSRLGTLTIGRSPLPDSPRCEWMVALALVRIFPSIRFLSSYCTEEMKERWEEVKGNVLVCQKIFRITATGKHLSTYVW